MAFEWLGTFNASMFNRLVAYAKDQLPLIEGRIKHLSTEQSRLGLLMMAKDSAGRPTGYEPPSANTYLGRLVAAYEILGGDVFHDLQVRSIGEPVYILKGTEVSSSKFFSNGEPIPQAGLADAPTANLVTEMRAWMSDSMNRRDYLERKIRRVLDYGDQLQIEIDRLKQIQGSVEAPHSLESIIATVNQHLSDPGYRATLDDKGQDIFGKFAKAPMSSYEPGPERTPPDGAGVEKTSTGYNIYGTG